MAAIGAMEAATGGTFIMSRNALILLLVAVVLALVLALSFRTYAVAQELPSAKAEALVNTALENMRGYGAFDEYYEFMGPVSDVEETVNLLTQDSEFVVAVSEGQLRPVSLSELYELGEIDDDYVVELTQTLLGVITEGDLLYQVGLQGQVSHLTVSTDATRVGGVLPMVSRLPETSYYPIMRQEECSGKILSRNIFGAPAETITVCIRATCSQNTPDICELLSIESRSWYFAFISHQPEALPVDGEIFGPYCRGVTHYKWGVKIGGIRVGEFADIEVGNFSFGGQGNVVAEVQCAN